jgi:hypothetical protein
MQQNPASKESVMKTTSQRPSRNNRVASPMMESLESRTLCSMAMLGPAQTVGPAVELHPEQPAQVVMAPLAPAESLGPVFATNLVQAAPASAVPAAPASSLVVPTLTRLDVHIAVTPLSAKSPRTILAVLQQALKLLVQKARSEVPQAGSHAALPAVAFTA